MKALRKFFGCAPKVGDKITACTDYGVRFEGVVTDGAKAKDEDFPHYRASGEFIISRWDGEVSKRDDDAIILTRTAKLA
jgi:hypothetical protein